MLCEQLCKDIIRNAAGTLTEKTEDLVFETIAIRENTVVSRVTLHNLRRECNEPIHAFGIRLSGPVSVCERDMHPNS